MDLAKEFHPPKAVRDVMSNRLEIETFEHWKSGAGKALHSSFGEKAQYDSQRAIWRVPLTHELETLLESAQRLDPSLNLKGCTWDDLLSHIETAIVLDEQKGQKNKLRAVARNTKADVQLLKSLVSIIPDEKGLSFLRGGLSIIFQSWAQRIETREQVLRLLADVIELFSSAAAHRRFFAGDEELRGLIFDLYGIMLNAIQELISILLRTHKGNWVQRVRKQLPIHEAQRVEEIMRGVENLKSRITNRLGILSIERNASTHRNTETIKSEVQATRYHVSTIGMNIQGIAHGVHRTQKTADKIYMQNQDISTQLNGIDTSVQNASANLERFVEASVAKQFQQWKQEFNAGLLNMHKENQDLVGMIQTSMYQFMGEKMNAERLGWLPLPIPQHQPLVYQPIDVPLEQVVYILNVDPTPMLQETQNMMRLTHAIQPNGLAKVRSLVSIPQFHNFLNLPFPNVLLVDGHCRDLGQGRTSPLSIFCASLAATLAQAEANVVLHFFCGHHNRPSDPVSGPAGLLRSLITQLILYPNTSKPLSVSMEQSMWDGTARFSEPALVALFEKLLCLFPPSNVIFLIVDNISDFQSALHGYSQSTVQILQHLHRLADERRPGPRLKLFLTSANRTFDAEHIVNQASGEYIALRADNVDSRGATMRGRPFEQDIRMLMQRTADTNLLDPLNRRRSGEGTYVPVERSRSAGRYM